MLFYLFGILSLVSSVLSYDKEEFETVVSYLKCKTKWSDEPGRGQPLTKTDSKIITLDPGEDYAYTPTSTKYTTKTYTVTVTPTVPAPNNYIYLGATISPLPLHRKVRRGAIQEGPTEDDDEEDYGDKYVNKVICTNFVVVAVKGQVPTASTVTTTVTKYKQIWATAEPIFEACMGINGKSMLAFHEPTPLEEVFGPEHSLNAAESTQISAYECCVSCMKTEGCVGGLFSPPPSPIAPYNCWVLTRVTPLTCSAGEANGLTLNIDITTNEYLGFSGPCGTFDKFNLPEIIIG